MRNRNPKNSNAAALWWLAAFIGALAMVGSMDATDQQAQQEYTCEMIASGAWPEEVEPSCAEARP